MDDVAMADHDKLVLTVDDAKRFMGVIHGLVRSTGRSVQHTTTVTRAFAREILSGLGVGQTIEWSRAAQDEADKTSIKILRVLDAANEIRLARGNPELFSDGDLARCPVEDSMAMTELAVLSPAPAAST